MEMCNVSLGILLRTVKQHSDGTFSLALGVMASQVKFSTEVKHNHICTLGPMYEQETSYVIQQLQIWK
jgi:hypothetical protein